MTKSEYKDLATQRSFDLERAVEKIEKQEALIEHLRETILAYSKRVASMMETFNNIEELIKDK